MKCALCDKVLDSSSDSKEHVISNAVGGRRKIAGVLCVACNNVTGERWDSALAAQLNPLSLLFGIKRERGVPPSQVFETATGNELRLHHDGSMTPAHPSYSEEPVGEKSVQIRIAARSMREMRAMLKGATAKHPKSNIEALMATAQQQTNYVEDALKISLPFGGPLAGRSLVKSALCLAVASGVDAHVCADARGYLSDDKAEACFGHYYERDLLRNRPERIPFHCIAISSRGTDDQFLGYAEFYGCRRVVMCLASAYSGPEVHLFHAVDPVSGEDLQIEFDLALSRADIAATFAHERVPEGAMETAVSQMLPLAMRNVYEREKLGRMALTLAVWHPATRVSA